MLFCKMTNIIYFILTCVIVAIVYNLCASKHYIIINLGVGCI